MPHRSEDDFIVRVCVRESEICPCIYTVKKIQKRLIKKKQRGRSKWHQRSDVKMCLPARRLFEIIISLRLVFYFIFCFFFVFCVFFFFAYPIRLLGYNIKKLMDSSSDGIKNTDSPNHNKHPSFPSSDALKVNINTPLFVTSLAYHNRNLLYNKNRRLLSVL